MKVIGTAPRKHRCWEHLPQRKSWFRKHDLMFPGSLVECSCGVVYVWTWQGYAETWGWIRYDGEGY